jgi:spermidine synthase
LASGVTAGAVLEFPTLTHLTLVELEPKVVQASHAFDHVNGQPLDDPRTQLLVQDARAVLAQEGPDFDVIISEPSNPWITGVSNLFTVEYWVLGERRLAPDGVFCQWIQLYGLAPTEFQSIVASFTSVFPETWLFEPLEGGDVLLMGSTGAPSLNALPIAPTLGPKGVLALGKGGVLNTDDRPVVELAAPRSLHLATVGPNLARIAEVQARYGLE